MKISPVIEIGELDKIFLDSDVIIFDASNHKNAQSNYQKTHLEGAFFIDTNSVLSDPKKNASKGGRHPLPHIKYFAKKLSDLGISKDKHVIIYDDKNGANAAARFWWMLKAIGHDKVQVLNGGLNEARKYGLALSSKIETINSISEPYPFQEWILPTIEIEELKKIIQNPDYLIVDVREKYRFDGESEPIDLIAGHIPGAINIPFSENLDQNGHFLQSKDLKKKYEDIFKEIKAKNIVVHCGSGITACHTLLALVYAELEIPNLYVGSWSEWSRNQHKIEVNKK